MTTCPRCGEDIYYLPPHLTACPGSPNEDTLTVHVRKLRKSQLNVYHRNPHCGKAPAESRAVDASTLPPNLKGCHYCTDERELSEVLEE